MSVLHTLDWNPGIPGHPEEPLGSTERGHWHHEGDSKQHLVNVKGDGFFQPPSLALGGQMVPPWGRSTHPTLSLSPGRGQVQDGLRQGGCAQSILPSPSRGQCRGQCQATGWALCWPPAAAGTAAAACSAGTTGPGRGSPGGRRFCIHCTWEKKGKKQTHCVGSRAKTKFPPLNQVTIPCPGVF